MSLFGKILSPVDFSRYSEVALRYAAALATRHASELILYHAVPDLSQAISYLEGNYVETVNEDLTARARQKLQELISAEVPEKLTTSIHVGLTNAAEGILQTAREQRVDLIVMGTHGYAGPERFFMGSITNKILHKSMVPVLVISDLHLSPASALEGAKKILCAIDLEPNNRQIRDLALSVAQDSHAEIAFLNVVPVSKEEQTSFSVDGLYKIVDPSHVKGCAVRFLVKYGEPGQEILKTAEQEKFDLIVMGHHTRRPIEEVFLGSVAKRVVVDSNCPVLIVRSRSSAVLS